MPCLGCPVLGPLRCRLFGQAPDEMLGEEPFQRSRDAVSELVVASPPAKSEKFREQRLLAERTAFVDLKSAGCEAAPEGELREEAEVIALLFRGSARKGFPTIGEMSDVRRRKEEPTTGAKDTAELTYESLGVGDMLDHFDHRDAIERLIGKGQVAAEVRRDRRSAFPPCGRDILFGEVERDREGLTLLSSSRDELALPAPELGPTAGASREELGCVSIPGAKRIAETHFVGCSRRTNRSVCIALREFERAR